RPLAPPGEAAPPRKFPEVGVKNPAEPDAFAFAPGTDPVHPIVPVSRADQRKAVAANRQTAVERAWPMFEKCTALRGHAWLEIRLVLPSRERWPVEEGNNFVEETDM